MSNGPDGEPWTVHLPPAERLEALWQLVVFGVAFVNAGRDARNEDGERLSTDESQFRRDVVRVVRRGS